MAQQTWFRKLLFAIWLCGLGAAIPLPGEASEPFADDRAAARAMVERLAENLEETHLSVKIGPLTKTPERVAGRFAERFVTLMESEMSRAAYRQDFVAIAPERIDENMIRTRSLARSQGPGKRIVEQGESRIVEVVLKGEYRLSGDGREILLKSGLERADGTEASRAVVRLARSATDLPLGPANEAVVKQAVQRMEAVQRARREFRIDLCIDRGNGGIYRNGDRLRLYFRSELPCYLKVLFVDTEGRRVPMYPTEEDPKGKLAAGKIHALHERNRYTVQPPFGSEMIVAVASTEPLGDRKEAQGDPAGGYRSLGVTPRPSARLAETSLFLTTRP